MIRAKAFAHAVSLFLFGAGFAGGAIAAEFDLCPYKMTFSEEFDTLSVSAADNEHYRWSAHTPWHGDFGDSKFVDPTPDFPFKVENGILAIEVSKGPDGKWRSGLLSSTDPEGHGYAQQYGYFEARAKIPPGPGVWPAFWLTTNQPKTVPEPGVEFDMMEYYGRAPDEFKSTIHVWYKGDEKSKTRHEGMKTKVPSGSLSEDFHLYGIDIAQDWTVYYLDRKEIGRMKTPVEHKKPLTILVNLGLGPGWPIDKTPNPSFFYVDYVRAYEKDDQKAASCGAAAH